MAGRRLIEAFQKRREVIAYQEMIVSGFEVNRSSLPENERGIP